MSRWMETRYVFVSRAKVASNGRCASGTAVSPRACQDLPGQELLQYVNEAGSCQDVTSSDVNDYLKEITGKDITAKDFRTWAGTVLAAMALNELESFDSAVQAKRNLRAAIEKLRANSATRRPSAANAMCIPKF